MIITINRPDARNAVNAAVSTAVGDACRPPRTIPRSGRWSSPVRARASAPVPIQGDLAAREHLSPRPRGVGFAGYVQHYIDKPTIAAVNGNALGGGTELALASDLVIAEERSKFGLPEVKRGLIAAAGGVFRIVDQLPRKVAMELLFTGEPITAAQAREWGLINEVVPDGTVVEAGTGAGRTDHLQRPAGQSGPAAVIHGVDDGVIAGDEAGWQRTMREIGGPKRSEDAKEGRGHLPRSAPVWKASDGGQHMKRTIYDEEHEAFRDTVRGYIETELVPHAEKWEAERLVDRSAYVAAGKHGPDRVQHARGVRRRRFRRFRFNAIIDEEIAKAGVAAPALSLHNDVVGPYFMIWPTMSRSSAGCPASPAVS